MPTVLCPTKAEILVVVKFAASCAVPYQPVPADVKLVLEVLGNLPGDQVLEGDVATVYLQAARAACIPARYVPDQATSEEVGEMFPKGWPY